MEVISCKDAKDQGLKFYFTGNPCKNGEIAKRRVSGCCVCEYCNQEKLDRTNLWRGKNKDHLKKQKAEWYRKNADKEIKRSIDYQKRNKERVRERERRYLKENGDMLRARARERYHANREEILNRTAELRKADRQKFRDYAKKYADNNRDIIRERYRSRMVNDPIFALKSRVRGRLAAFIRSSGHKKKTGTQEMIGCEWGQLKRHIELQFKKGMTWDNMGKWHIDHIIPLSIAETEDDVFWLNHFTNLRPCWAKENISKSDKRVFLI